MEPCQTPTRQPPRSSAPSTRALILLDRVVGWITTVVFGGALAIGVITVLVAGQGLPFWMRLAVVFGRLAIVAVLAWHGQHWPTVSFAHTRYRVDDEGIEIQRGVFWREVINVPRSRVQHTDVTQGPIDRRFGLGTLVIFTAGTDFARVELPGSSTATRCASAPTCCRGRRRCRLSSDCTRQPSCSTWASSSGTSRFPACCCSSPRRGRPAPARRSAPRAGSARRLLFIVPAMIMSVTRYLSFRLRDELLTSSSSAGPVLPLECHVPYARIQNLDAVQNVVHRVLGVVEVRIETGGGKEAEAAIRVLPMAAFTEMRRRVFEGRTAAAVPASVAEDGDGVEPAPAVAPATLLRLSLGDLLLYGFIESRGMVLIGAAYGAIWKWACSTASGSACRGRSGIHVPRSATCSPTPSGKASSPSVSSRSPSPAWWASCCSCAWSRWPGPWCGCTASRDAGRRRPAHPVGPLTRVTVTIPLHHVATVTVRESALTAGPNAVGEGRRRRAATSPATGRAIRDGRAAYRARRRSPRPCVMSCRPSILEASRVASRCTPCSRVPSSLRRRRGRDPLSPAGRARLGGRSPRCRSWRGCRHRHEEAGAQLAWVADADVVVFRSGWLWRRSPWHASTASRPWRCDSHRLRPATSTASVRVDTEASAVHRVELPYPDVAVAYPLRARRPAQAAETEFRGSGAVACTACTAGAWPRLP